MTAESVSFAEISRKWLADIAPENFSACHKYLAAVRFARGYGISLASLERFFE